MLEEAAKGAKAGVGRIRDRRRKTRRRLEEIFSREVLGSVLVSLAAGKMVEQIVVIVAPGRPLRFVAWTVAFVVFVIWFVKWEAVAEKAKEVAETAEDAAQ